MERTKLFNPNAKFNINDTSVFMNADIEYDRQLEINALLNQNPITAQNPRILRSSLERVILASRVPGREDLIPREDETPEALTNSMERDIEAKEKLTQEKQNARMLGDQAKRQHEKEMALIEASSAIAQTPPPDLSALQTGAEPQAPLGV